MVSRRRFLRCIPSAGLGIVAFAALPKAAPASPIPAKAIEHHLDAMVIATQKACDPPLMSKPFDFSTTQKYEMRMTKKIREFYFRKT